jgi:penicillin-binding protein-related factor A (putative recombinase)
MKSSLRKTPKAFTASSTSSKPESVIENEILHFLLKVRGGFFWKNTTSGFFDGKRFRKHASPFAINGTSDILGVYDGRLVAFEVKSQKGKLTKDQIAFLKKIEASGGVGAVVNSVEKVRECFLKWFDVFLE